MITANEAKLLASKGLEDTKSRMLEHAFKGIKDAAESGKFQYYYRGHMVESVLSMLKNNGYKVDRPNQYGFVISWDA